jgi:hypothetical protein
VVNVLAPLSINQIREGLEDAKFISAMIDSSNHKHTKLVPILIRYFIPQQVVKMKVLEFSNLSQAVSPSVDNTNADFVGAKRRGKNNIFERLRNKIKRYIIGVGCAAHIVHNATQTAADCLLVDIVLLARYISISTFILCVFKH